MKFDFSIAQVDDDAELRQLLKNCPMPGNTTLTLEREPDYFMGCATMGFPYQVVIARNSANHELAGMVYRGLKQRYINGRSSPVGYIGQARVLPKYQGTMLPIRVLPLLRKLDEEYPVDHYFTVIAENNAPARSIFAERARPSIPPLCDGGRLCTLSIFLHKRFRQVRCAGFRQAKSSDSEALVSLLNRAGCDRQLYPVYSPADLQGGAAARDLNSSDFWVVERDGRICAAAALWDQGGFKQTRISAYHGWVKTLKPIYNRLCSIWGAQALPEPGDKLNAVYVAGLALGEQRIFPGLLNGLYHRAQERGFAFLLLQLHEQDPLLNTARRYPHIRYQSTLYTFSFRNAIKSLMPLDGRLPYLEPATL